MDHHIPIVDLLFQNRHLFANGNWLIWSFMIIMSKNLFHLYTLVMSYLSTSYTFHFFYLLLSNLLFLFCNLDSSFLTFLHNLLSLTLNFSLQLLSLHVDALLSLGFLLNGKFHCQILNVVLEFLIQHLLLLKFTTIMPISFLAFFPLIHLFFLQLLVFPNLHPILFNLTLV